jgi:anti-anti-sigma factor
MTTRSHLQPSTSTATATFDRAGRHLTVYLSGELDAASAPGITQAIFDHLQPDDQQVALDASELTFCDSSGLVLLFKLHQQATDAGAYTAVFNPTPPVRRIIEMCDPSGILNIRTDT